MNSTSVSANSHGPWAVLGSLPLPLPLPLPFPAAFCQTLSPVVHALALGFLPLGLWLPRFPRPLKALLLAGTAPGRSGEPVVGARTVAFAMVPVIVDEEEEAVLLGTLDSAAVDARSSKLRRGIQPNVESDTDL